jgi:pre-mRNA-splicing factor CDC5/CEF1
LPEHAIKFLPFLLIFAVLIKGGVWKNTEDEILKAAVMKYGLNQWSRISSLLVRKSAKQCKARWYEWLDPAIKKTEWTREEDEKLLHLAKLMPTQWRTIAPIVGRTPTQCLERYEKLLDMAAGKEGGYDARDDPRRLRPGEIDPHPEAKPARPDPVDMDEDEKEMLSEARARLANTRGKKAKRKAREKQLEEARRLAALQKKRELKAAGIDVREKIKKRGVDYSKEVAFERRPAAGFFDVAEEDKITREIQEHFRPVTKEELEGKKRKDIEADLMKNDMQRAKMNERKNVPAAVARAMAANEAQQSVRRGKMMLPAPQVSDMELEMIARQGAGAMDVDGLEGGSEATRALMGDYATPARFATPMQTPARTPAVPGVNKIIQEAQNLARLQAGQTPLLGGENPELHPSDFSGVVPRASANATPNPLAAAAAAAGGSGPTPAYGSGRSIAGIAPTPGRGGSGTGALLPPGATPTPMRDALGLNDKEAMLYEAGTRQEEKLRAALARNELRSGLGQLPAPKNEYQIAVPELPEGLGVDGDDEEMADGGVIEDAAERDARNKAARAAAIEAELKRRSQALQRDLPRPVALDMLPAIRKDSEVAGLGAAELAEELVNREVLALLHHDAAEYPLGGDGKNATGGQQATAPFLERFNDKELNAASELLNQESAAVRSAMGHESISAEEYASTWETVIGDILFVPSQQRYMRGAAMAVSDRAAALQADFERVRKEMEREAKRAAKLEQKVGVVTGGLVTRQQRLSGEVEGTLNELVAAEIELKCFQALHEQEQRAAPDRMEALQALVAAQAKKEADLQERYREAMLARDLAGKKKGVASGQL